MTRAVDVEVVNVGTDGVEQSIVCLILRPSPQNVPRGIGIDVQQRQRVWFVSIYEVPVHHRNNIIHEGRFQSYDFMGVVADSAASGVTIYYLSATGALLLMNYFLRSVVALK